MLQKTFGIYDDNLEGCQLFLEAGMQHFACRLKHEETNSTRAFEFFQFDADDINNLENVFRGIRMQSKLMIEGVMPQIIIWDMPDAIYVPSPFYNNDFSEAYLDITMGEKFNTVLLEDKLTDAVIVSRQPSHYTDIIRKYYPETTFQHKFSQLLKQYFNRETGSEVCKVYLVFYPTHFIFTAIKNNTLQLMQSINYATSEDVLYSIKNICLSYKFPLDTTPIAASGLIDTASNLFNTLYGYLENFSLEENTSVVFSNSFAEYPSHYFLPFISI